MCHISMGYTQYCTTMILKTEVSNYIEKCKNKPGFQIELFFSICTKSSFRKKWMNIQQPSSKCIMLIISQTPVSLHKMSDASFHTVYQTVYIVLIQAHPSFHDFNFSVCEIFCLNFHHTIFHDLPNIFYLI